MSGHRTEVYVLVTSPTTNGYQVEGVFSTKKKAEAYLKKLLKTQSYVAYGIEDVLFDAVDPDE